MQWHGADDAEEIWPATWGLKVGYTQHTTDVADDSLAFLVLMAVTEADAKPRERLSRRFNAVLEN